MKTQILSLLRYELTRFAWLVPIVYGFVIGGIFHQEMRQTVYMFNFSPPATQTSAVMLVYFAFAAVFYLSGMSQDAATSKNWANLDFFFSRAIDRRAWFCVKAFIFLVIVAVPVAWLHHLQPDTSEAKIELPYNSVAARHELTTFFQAHFPGTHLEKPDTGSNKDYLVVPNALRAMARFEVATDFFALITFQVVAFLFWPRFSSIWIPVIVLLFGPLLILYPLGHTPSSYERSLALVDEHPVSVLVVLILLYVAAQLFCCWRFVRTEMLV